MGNIIYYFKMGHFQLPELFSAAVAPSFPVSSWQLPTNQQTRREGMLSFPVFVQWQFQ